MSVPFVKPTSELDRQSLGKFELLCRLSTGGMSEIFLATQKGLAGFRKIVVLKSILPDIRGEDEFVRMFLEEARTTAAFNHPNIAQVFDLDIDDGTLFLSMEFVQGATLVEMARACRQAKEPIPLGFTLASVRDTALALHYAHNFADARGRKQVVIHRDVAEKNIMVTYDGTTKLLDFGIAKALGRRSGSMTSIGMVKGTSGYMSPEQIRGEPLDPRSDIFALGVVLHECLTGMRLFHGKNAEDGMLAALREDVAPPSRQSADVNPALDAVCLKALARDREQRYSTALEFARAVEKACPGMLWHPEQSGDLVQRFYAERREQTRDLVERAQGSAELTGELKLDKVMAQVSHARLQPVTSNPSTPPGGMSSNATPARRSPNAPTTPNTPAPRKPGVPPRATGERPQLSTDPVGINVKLSAAPLQSVGPSKSEVTEAVSASALSVNLSAPDEDDDDDAGAKTIPAAELPAELLAQIRGGQKLTITQSGRPTGGQPSNVVLDPVREDLSHSGESTNTEPSPSARDEVPFNPFAEDEEDHDQSNKTSIVSPSSISSHASPSDTHSDQDRGDEFDDRTDEGIEPRTHPGPRPLRGLGKFIALGSVLAVLALFGALYALKFPPFSPPPPKPPFTLRDADAPKVKPAPKPAVVKNDPKPDPAAEKAAAEKAEKEKAEKEKAEKEKAEQARLEKERLDQEKADKAQKAAQEQAEREKDKAAQKTADREKARADKQRRAEEQREKARREKEARAEAARNKPKPTPTPAPKPAKESAPSVTGVLSLVVDPPVRVSFGGKDLGTTPLKATLPVGRQSLKLIPASGSPKTISVEIKESGSAARFDLEDL